MNVFLATVLDLKFNLESNCKGNLYAKQWDSTIGHDNHYQFENMKSS